VSLVAIVLRGTPTELVVLTGPVRVDEYFGFDLLATTSNGVPVAGVATTSSTLNAL
jgi:hypothetical protein